MEFFISHNQYEIYLFLITNSAHGTLFRFFSSFRVLEVLEIAIYRDSNYNVVSTNYVAAFRSRGDAFSGRRGFSKSDRSRDLKHRGDKSLDLPSFPMNINPIFNNLL